MRPQKPIPSGTIVFLYGVSALADGAKFFLDLLFGIGVILDPVFITPITTFIFWIALDHNGIPMFSGRNATAAWTNEIISLTPGIDGLPDWLGYTTYLVVNDQTTHYIQGMAGFVQGIL